jgi:hypothetical protein
MKLFDTGIRGAAEIPRDGSVNVRWRHSGRASFQRGGSAWPMGSGSLEDFVLGLPV